MFGTRCRRQIAVAGGPLHLQRGDVRQAALLERRAAQHPGDVGQVGDGQGDAWRRQARAEHRRGQQCEQDAGEREQDVQAGGDHRVDGPRRQAAVTASSVPTGMLMRRQPAGRASRLRTGQQPGRHVAALEVIAKQVAAAPGRPRPATSWAGWGRRERAAAEHGGERGERR